MSARSSRRSGFSLVEVMVVATLSSMILAATVSAFVLIGRSAVATSDYAEFDEEARKGLELFARETRMAEDVLNFSTTSITLRVRGSAGTYDVTYSYLADSETFVRAPGTPDAMVLIGDVDQFQLKRYTLTRQPAEDHLETKQLQLQLRSIRSGAARALASNNVVSARFILRNKSVSN